MQRPGTLKSLLDSWQLTLEHGSAWSLIPYWLIASGFAGFLLAAYLPASFWDGSKLDVAVSVMSGLLTFNGIILALCWSAFGKIYEIIGAGTFSAHLRKHSLLNQYLVVVGWCHISQIVAIVFSGLALFSLWLPLQTLVLKATVGFAVAASVYALRQGFSTSTIMQDLIWRKATFDEGARSMRPITAAV